MVPLEKFAMGSEISASTANICLRLVQAEHKKMKSMSEFSPSDGISQFSINEARERASMLSEAMDELKKYLGL